MAKKRPNKSSGTSGRLKRGDDVPRAKRSTQPADAKKAARGGSGGNGAARLQTTTKRPAASTAKPTTQGKASSAGGKRAQTQSTSRIRAQATQASDLKELIRREVAARIQGNVEEHLRGGIAAMREEVAAAVRVEAKKVARWISRYCKAARGELSNAEAQPSSSVCVSQSVADVEEHGIGSSDVIHNQSLNAMKDDAREDGVTRETDTAVGSGTHGIVGRERLEADAERQIIDDLYARGTDKPYDLLVLMLQAKAVASRNSSGEWEFTTEPFKWKTAYEQLDRRTVDKVREKLCGDDLFIIEPNPVPVSEEAAQNANRKKRTISRGGYLTPRGEKVARDELTRREEEQACLKKME